MFLIKYLIKFKKHFKFLKNHLIFFLTKKIILLFFIFYQTYKYIPFLIILFTLIYFPIKGLFCPQNSINFPLYQTCTFLGSNGEWGKKRKKKKKQRQITVKKNKIKNTSGSSWPLPLTLPFRNTESFPSPTLS